MTTDPKLAGQPERVSGPFDRDHAETFTGFIKLRLGHSQIGSVFVPEQLFIEHDGRWLFFQVSFFSPPRLGFNIEPNVHVALFNIDVGDPLTTAPTRAVVTVMSNELGKRFADGAHLYRCSIEAPRGLLGQPSGEARRLSNGDFELHLFHVTNPSAAAGILASRELRASSWNLQGTRKLANVAYVYLTSLPSIRTDADLRRIAMASDGFIYFQTTSERFREHVLRLAVYRESTTGRTQSLPVKVATALLAPPHLLIHRTTEEAYYEVIGPEIFRIGLKPGGTLRYEDDRASATPDIEKSFSYIVVGDAAERAGLAAPYDEEDTKQVLHLERLAGTDPFKFWLDNANSDQMTGRSFEPRRFC